MSLPSPVPGLVISYSYPWAREHGQGAEEGRKTRPCAIVAARQVMEGHEVVTVVPVTHSPPADPADAVEIPPALKAHLGLDEMPSWIVVTETNDFLWPGPNLVPLPRTRPSRFDYGMLPPRFFAHVRDKILKAHLQRKLNRVPRSD
ncbi:MAG: type II toxin-antitoxin system PemK/MazF family toxin [Proteobacteria bacterium]|nr:type II toxin-antitoxin system PemK/MazF family toxin [Pseudomonadota bacterium]